MPEKLGITTACFLVLELMGPERDFNRRELQARQVWLANGRTERTIGVYLMWVRRFHRWLGEQGRGSLHSLNLSCVTVFAEEYAQRRGIPVDRAVRAARCALKSWAFVMGMAGHAVPTWEVICEPKPLSPLVADYRDFRLRHAGITLSTWQRELPVVVEFLRGRHVGALAALTIVDVDDHLTAVASRVGKKTLARIGSSLRAFLRFLRHKGLIPVDLAGSITTPVVRAGDRPPRALPWDDVRRLLSAVDTSRRTGRRDYALMLMMAVYGMGAAEVLGLELDDVHWRNRSIRVVRPKTGINYLLPLLPAVANALLEYLRDGRPQRVHTRRLFVAAVVPHGPMSPSSARRAVRRAAAAAELANRPMLGCHALRHSHACRQVELRAPMKVVGDILGHRSPTSTSAYTRVATSRLRELALPVPL